MTLFLRRLSHCTLEVFTQVLDLSSAHVVIENCRVDGLTFLGYPRTLWGTNLYGDPSDLIRNWEGSEIVLQNCLGFNDDTLSLLRPRENPAYHGLDVLKLLDCPNFTSSGLRKLVEDRFDALQCIDDLALEPLGFWELTVVDPRPLDEETTQWFRNRVHSFWWCSGRPTEPVHVY